MTSVEAGLTTNFPRPEAIVGATREFDRGRKTAQELAGLFDQWALEVIRLEQQAGLSWTTGGHLTSQDLFRPLVEASEGIVTGPLTRWYETNTFYRQPVVEGLPRVKPGRLAAWFAQHQHSTAVILPGPWTLARLAENRTTLEELDFLKALGGFLGESISELSAAGATRFILHEPELVVRPPGADEVDILERSYRPVGSALGKHPSIIWTYFADGAPVSPLLSKLPVGGLGVDLSETKPEELRSWSGSKVLGLGCLDARTSLPEDPRELFSIVRDLEHRVAPPGFILGPGVPLDLLPWDAAARKVEVLTQAMELIRGGK